MSQAKVFSNWLHENNNELSVLQWPSQSSDLNPVGLLNSVGCGRTGDSQHENAPGKSLGIVWYSHVSIDQNLKAMFSIFFSTIKTNPSEMIKYHV